MQSSPQPDPASTAAAESAATGETPIGRVPFFAVLRGLQTRRRSLVGRDTRPAKEPVRLKAEAALAHPATELARSSTDGNGRMEMEVSFLGLFGPSGTLPQHYTQLIIDRSRHKDTALREFLDLFNHRWISLFYRAWEKHDYPSAFLTSHSLGQEDTLTRILWSLIGLGTPGLRGRLRLEEAGLLHFAGLLSDSKPRESSLAGMLSAWFHIPVEVQQFQGAWIRIPADDQTRMRNVRLGESSHNRLGFDSVAGGRVWDVENRFRIRLGPLDAVQFQRFSPQGGRLAALTALARLFVGPQLDFDVQVVVRRAEVPATQLSGSQPASRLGYNTWLGRWPFARDADDAVFELDDNATVSAADESGDPPSQAGP